jgi:ATP-dependent Clp protease ATP-binding subunit ClpC
VNLDGYTKKARRVIFFARYEAGDRGDLLIEPCHLLAGLEREAKWRTKLFLFQNPGMETLRRRTSVNGIPRLKVPTLVDMPLADASKRALSAAIACAEGRANVGTAELLRGLLSVAKG